VSTEDFKQQEMEDGMECNGGKFSLLTYRNFDRHSWINSVLVKQIDVVHTKSLQTGLTSFADILWSAYNVDPPICRNGTKLGGQLYFLSRQILQCLGL
jgi:hypothetical protein